MDLGMYREILGEERYSELMKELKKERSMWGRIKNTSLYETLTKGTLMSNDVNATPTENEDHSAEAHDTYVAKMKKNKKLKKFFAITAIAGAAALALKYIATPVPEWADDSEDV